MYMTTLLEVERFLNSSNNNLLQNHSCKHTNTKSVFNNNREVMDHSKHWYSNINDPMKNVISDKYFVRNYYYIFHRIINVSIPMFALIHSLYIINNSIAE